jgi:uncharacterized protein
MEMHARDLTFELTDAVSSHWSPEQPEFSQFANALMAALPYLEPYFIHNVREAVDRLSDPHMRAEAHAFVQQEAHHAHQHRRWNRILAARYPGFDALEQAIKARLHESKRKHTLAFRLAYTAGYEAITYQLVCFIMAERHIWLKGADPRLVALLSWHAAEEIEHKSVAFDVFEAIDGAYWLRVWGLSQALVHTLRDLRGMARHLMRADGVFESSAARRRLWQVRWALAKGILPELRHYLRPSYHPSDHVDPPLIAGWLAEERAGEDLRELDLAALDALAKRIFTRRGTEHLSKRAS